VVRRRRWTRSPEAKLRRHLNQKERRTQRQQEIIADQRLRELEPKRLAQSLRRNQKLKTRRASQLVNRWQSQKRSRLLPHLWRSVFRRSAKLGLQNRVKTTSQKSPENKQLPSPAHKESASGLSPMTKARSKTTAPAKIIIEVPKPRRPQICRKQSQKRRSQKNKLLLFQKLKKKKPVKLKPRLMTLKRNKMPRRSSMTSVKVRLWIKLRNNLQSSREVNNP
jgi:hypothetical protein